MHAIIALGILTRACAAERLYPRSRYGRRAATHYRQRVQALVAGLPPPWGDLYPLLLGPEEDR